MSHGESSQCPGAEEIFSDLQEDNLLELNDGERLWKLYCFRGTGHANDLRHRIYTKRKVDGRLAWSRLRSITRPPRSQWRCDRIALRSARRWRGCPTCLPPTSTA